VGTASSHPKAASLSNTCHSNQPKFIVSVSLLDQTRLHFNIDVNSSATLSISFVYFQNKCFFLRPRAQSETYFKKSASTLTSKSPTFSAWHSEQKTSTISCLTTTSSVNISRPCSGETTHSTAARQVSPTAASTARTTPALTTQAHCRSYPVSRRISTAWRISSSVISRVSATGSPLTHPTATVLQAKKIRAV